MCKIVIHVHVCMFSFLLQGANGHVRWHTAMMDFEAAMWIGVQQVCFILKSIVLRKMSFIQ